MSDTSGPVPDDIATVLDDLARGDASATERLLPHVYQELRALAGAFFRGRSTGHTLQPTALVHEAFVRLVRTDGDFDSRRHFMNVAAMAMRQILADHARRKRADKRGGDWQRVTLSGTPDERDGIDIVALDDALTKLASLDARQARVVELRFLAGMTVPEAAAVLDVSPRTIDADWRLARAWLQRELSG